MKNYLLATLIAASLVFISTEVAVAQDDPAMSAMVDSYELQHIVDAASDLYLNDYVKFYMGHINCAYDFVDDDQSNRIADTFIKGSVEAGHDFLLERENGIFANLSEDDQVYFGNMLVFMMIGNVSTEISDRHANMIAADPDYCQKNAEADEAIYVRLGHEIE